MTVEDFLTGYVEGTLGKKTKEGGWRVEPVANADGITKLVFHGMRRVGGRRYGNSEEAAETVAYRLKDGTTIYNANVLEIAVKKTWGRTGSRDRAECQIVLERAGATPIPFSLFEEAGMELDEAVLDFAWVVKPIAEHTVRGFAMSHFSGACVYRVGDRYYLFDIDRQETAHAIFNPFVTQLGRPAKSIEDAYASLMPDEVRNDIEKGIDVKRQGEYYFVKIGDKQPVKAELTDEERHILRYPPSRMGFLMEPHDGYTWNKDDTEPIPEPKTQEELAFNEAATRYNAVVAMIKGLIPTTMSLSEGGSGSHKATGINVNGTKYVTGTVTHNNRQHADLMLEGWYMVVKNAAIRSVTIQGRID